MKEKEKQKLREAKQEIKKKAVKSFFLICLITLFTIAILLTMNYFNIIPKKYYKAPDFNIKTIYSDIDFDNDNIDDYTDFVLGARKESENNIIETTFKNAGYSLRDMINNDIIDNKDKYNVNEIDFTRISSLVIYFDRYAEKLTLDPKEIKEWQPGDIVVFSNNHIGIISDKRNNKGIPYVIHNNNQTNIEEDYLTKNHITNHYRFNANLIPPDKLIKWHE